MRPNSLSALALALLACGAAAQEHLPFPLGPVDAAQAAPGLVRAPLAPQPDALEALAASRQVRMVQVPWPEGAPIELDLRRVDLARPGFRFHVDGAPRPELDARSLELTLWTGSVVGEPGSDCLLAFSPWGSRGWIRRAAGQAHLVAGPGADGTWSRSTSELVLESELLSAGRTPPTDFCAAERIQDLPAVRVEDLPAPGYQGTAPLLECQIAIESDYQLYADVFGGSLGATASYVMTLLGALSDRYTDEISVQLSFPYLGLHSVPNDGWSTPDQGGSTGQMLNEFRMAWANNIPANANLAHFLSGAPLGGGVAYLDVLCSPDFGFGVSADLTGGVQFPVMQAPFNWDFYVIAHELGHNFGSPHTHDYCPVLDSCAPQMYFGQCQTQQVCTTSGTIMSYCHLCSGGVNNITTFFHPTVKTRMRNEAESSCLIELCSTELYCGGKGNSFNCVPYVTFTGHPSASDSTPFRITGNDVMPDQFGFLIYGSAKAHLAFHNATLCVKAPFVRLLPPKSSGNTAGGFCKGELVTNFNKHIQSAADPSLTAGAFVAAQWRYRDPGIDQWNDGFTDGISFVVCP